MNSEILELYLRVEDHDLRVSDAQTGESLLTSHEAQSASRTEITARRDAESEIARLKAELERLRQKRD